MFVVKRFEARISRVFATIPVISALTIAMLLHSHTALAMEATECSCNLSPQECIPDRCIGPFLESVHHCYFENLWKGPPLGKDKGKCISKVVSSQFFGKATDGKCPDNSVSDEIECQVVKSKYGDETEEYCVPSKVKQIPAEFKFVGGRPGHKIFENCSDDEDMCEGSCASGDYDNRNNCKLAENLTMGKCVSHKKNIAQ